MSKTAILYSFRRCPYAMRARMALSIAQIQLEHREILLKNKPPHMLELSSKGTVPVLWLPDNTVLEESLDIMLWALNQFDPDDFLAHKDTSLQSDITKLIAENDTSFKSILDKYKYADRHPQYPAEHYRAEAQPFLDKLEIRLNSNNNLCSARATLADIAIMPFVRQFAHVDRDWFDAQPIPRLISWLDSWLDSELFTGAMRKHPLWEF